jgi:hypothetical protein
MKQQFWAVYEEHGPIYCIGQSEQNAWDQAKAVHIPFDILRCRRCTLRLATEMQWHGGNIAYKVNSHGQLTLAGTKAERNARKAW